MKIIKWWYEEFAQTIYEFKKTNKITIIDFDDVNSNTYVGFVGFSIFISFMIFIMLPVCIIGEIITLPCQLIGYITMLIANKIEKGKNNEQTKI